jgi:hypothetical protein
MPPCPNYSVEFVRELKPMRPSAVQALVRGTDGRHFVVSSVTAMLSGPETLVFEADTDGNVTDWLEVAGGRGMSRDEAIADLASNGPPAPREVDPDA